MEASWLQRENKGEVLGHKKARGGQTDHRPHWRCQRAVAPRQDSSQGPLCSRHWGFLLSLPSAWNPRAPSLPEELLSSLRRPSLRSHPPGFTQQTFAVCGLCSSCVWNGRSLRGCPSLGSEALRPEEPVGVSLAWGTNRTNCLN